MTTLREIDASVVAVIDARTTETPALAWPLAAAMIVAASVGMWMVIFRLLHRLIGL